MYKLSLLQGHSTCWRISLRKAQVYYQWATCRKVLIWPYPLYLLWFYHIMYKSPREGKYLEKTNSLEILAVHVLVLRVHWWNWLALQCACWATSFWTSETTLLQVYLDKVTCETKESFPWQATQWKTKQNFSDDFFFSYLLKYLCGQFSHLCIKNTKYIQICFAWVYFFKKVIQTNNFFRYM